MGERRKSATQSTKRTVEESKPVAEEPKFTPWDYATDTVEAGELEAVLRKYGRAGWELVAALPTNIMGQWTLVFKRGA